MAQFDALAAAQSLESAGMERRQAEAVAAACREAAGAGRPVAATKADAEAVRTDLTTLTWRFFGALTVHLLATAGLLVAVLDRLP